MTFGVEKKKGSSGRERPRLYRKTGWSAREADGWLVKEEQNGKKQKINRKKKKEIIRVIEKKVLCARIPVHWQKQFSGVAPLAFRGFGLWAFLAEVCDGG